MNAQEQRAIERAHTVIDRAERVIERNRRSWHLYWTGSYLVVNVKLRGTNQYPPDQKDIEKMIREITTDERVVEHALKIATPEHAEAAHGWFMDGERRYLVEDWLDNRTDVKTAQADVERVRTEGNTDDILRAEIELANKRKIREWASYFDEKYFAFAGRSGGWFIFAKESLVQDLMGQLEDVIAEYSDNERVPQQPPVYTIDDIQDYTIALEDCLDAVEWLISEVEQMRDSLDFWAYYRECHLPEVVREAQAQVQKEDEVSQAIEIARRHGLVVARPINPQPMQPMIL